MSKYFKILFFLFFLIISGCGYFIIAFKNIGEAITESPGKVENKIKNVVKPDVKLAATWIGHSTVLLQMYDKVLIFDPFYNNYLGGVFIRRLEAGVDLNEISKIDMILISLTHMDHLSFGTLDKLEVKFPKAKLIFPLGAEYYMPAYDFDMIRIDNKKAIKEYIGNPVMIDSVKVTPVYAKHPGGRYAIDVYSWRTESATGYIVEYKGICVYFPGDTGYDSLAFKKIGSKFDIDLAFIPVGPCKTCESEGFWYHTSSFEALEQFRDLNAKIMIPIHFGAIKYIRDENYPIEIFKKILDKDFTDMKDKVKILRTGEQIILKK